MADERTKSNELELTSEQARKFYERFLGLPCLFGMIDSERTRSYNSAIKTIIKTGLAEDPTKAESVLESLIDMDKIRIGDLDLSFGLEMMRGSKRGLRVKMCTYEAMNALPSGSSGPTV